VILAITGHRPSKLGGFSLPNPTYLKVCQALDAKFRELKPEKIIVGMSQGIDQYAAFVAHKLGIPFIAAVPFVGQEKIWPAAAQKTYHQLLKLASKQVIVSEGGYSIEKMMIRNEWMVDQADMILACFDKTTKNGGTYNCIQYVIKKSKPIIFIDPKEL